MTTWMAPSTPEVIGLTTAVLVAWNTWRQSLADKKAAKVEKVVNAVHTLTNSAMGSQLKLNVEFAERISVQAHRLADLSKQDADIAAALAADVVVKEQEAVYQEHLVRQAKVDSAP